MANNVLFCQKCATPHQPDFPWIFWSDFRLDSFQCKDQLIGTNTDVLQEEKKVNEVTRQIVEKLHQQERKRRLIAKRHYLRERIFRSELNKCLNKFLFKKTKDNFKKWVNCLSCKQEICKSVNICPNCNKYTKSHLINFSYPTKKRNEEIVALLDQGVYTLEQAGSKFGFSRERARQIYIKMTGKNYTIRRRKEKLKLEIKRKTEFKIKENSIKFYCKACNKPQTFSEAGKRFYLCLQCRLTQIQQKKDPYIRFICRNCNGSFNPHRNWKAMETKPQFCKLSCYLQFQGKSINIKKSLDKWYGKQVSFDAFFFRYRTLNQITLT